MDQNMKKLLVLIGCLVALLVICVVVVGMIDGFWPWQNQTEDGTTLESTTLDDNQTTQDTLDTTQDTTGEATQDTTEETGGNEGSNSGSNSGSNAGDIEIPIGTEKPGPSIGVEEGEGPTETTGTNQGGNNQGGTNFEIDFDDLLGNN